MSALWLGITTDENLRLSTLLSIRQRSILTRVRWRAEHCPTLGTTTRMKTEKATDDTNGHRLKDGFFICENLHYLRIPSWEEGEEIL